MSSTSGWTGTLVTTKPGVKSSDSLRNCADWPCNRCCQMLSELGYAPTAAGVLDVYAGLVDVYLIDRVDAGLSDEVARRGARPVVTDALMRGRRGEARLARVLLKAVSRR